MRNMRDVNGWISIALITAISFLLLGASWKGVGLTVLLALLYTNFDVRWEK